MAVFDPADRSLAAIARRLTATREALEINQTELCRRAGIAKNTYNQLEKAKGRPSIDTAIRIRDTFGLTLDWIFLGDLPSIQGRLGAQIAARMAASAPQPKST